MGELEHPARWEKDNNQGRMDTDMDMGMESQSEARWQRLSRMMHTQWRARAPTARGVLQQADAIDAEIELRRQDPKRVASLKSGNIDYEDFREDLRSISKNR